MGQADRSGGTAEKIMAGSYSNAHGANNLKNPNAKSLIKLVK